MGNVYGCLPGVNGGNSRKSICHNVEFAFDMLDIGGKLRDEGKVSCLPWRTIGLTYQSRCQWLVISVAGKRIGLLKSV